MLDQKESRPVFSLQALEDDLQEQTEIRATEKWGEESVAKTFEGQQFLIGNLPPPGAPCLHLRS